MTMRSLALLAMAAILCACAAPRSNEPYFQNAVYVVGDSGPALDIDNAQGEQPSALKRIYWFFAGR